MLGAATFVTVASMRSRASATSTTTRVSQMVRADAEGAGVEGVAVSVMAKP